MRLPLALAILVLMAGLNLLVWGVTAFEEDYAERIYPGVWVEDIPVGQLTREEAREKLAPSANLATKRQVTLVIQSAVYSPSLADLGYRPALEPTIAQVFTYGRERKVLGILGLILFSPRKAATIPLAYTVDQDVLDQYLEKVTASLGAEPRDMTLKFEGGKVIATPPQDGLMINRPALIEAVQAQVQPGRNEAVRLSLERQKPLITNSTQVAQAKEQLEKLLNQPLRLEGENLSFEITPETLYTLLRQEVKERELTLSVDEGAVKSYVESLAKKIDRRPIPKRLLSIDSSVLGEGSDGRRLNRQEMTRLIAERLSQTGSVNPIPLPVDKLAYPVVTEEPEYQTGRYSGKYIEIDLSAQKLHVLEGENHLAEYPVSTGKWSTPTPKGEFSIKNHIRTAWSKRYNLYMPFWMAIKEADGSYDGYGIHGLPYWKGGAVEGRGHLGRRVSHGCIRLSQEAAETVYNWTEEETTKVFIHD